MPDTFDQVHATDEALRDSLAAALSGRFELGDELARGGFAIVYRGHDIRHTRPVAIKVLQPEISMAIGGERFERELRILARLCHPHIVPVFDSGRADGRLYYVMPLVDGESLRGRLSREGPLPIADTLRITAELAAALDYAHTRGVVHRDIKPDNILLSAGVVMLADFGISRSSADAADGAATQPGLAIGSPMYMSPEQAAGDQLDGRSDVYALACVTYEMLAGHPPFQGDAMQVIARHLTEPPPPIRTSRDTVPAELEAAVLAGLAKLPADRPATAGGFAASCRDPAPSPSKAAVAPSPEPAPPAPLIIRDIKLETIAAVDARVRDILGRGGRTMATMAVVAAAPMPVRVASAKLTGSGLTVPRASSRLPRESPLAGLPRIRGATPKLQRTPVPWLWVALLAGTVGVGAVDMGWGIMLGAALVLGRLAWSSRSRRDQVPLVHAAEVGAAIRRQAAEPGLDDTHEPPSEPAHQAAAVQEGLAELESGMRKGAVSALPDLAMAWRALASGDHGSCRMYLLSAITEEAPPRQIDLLLAALEREDAAPPFADLHRAARTAARLREARFRKSAQQLEG